MLVLSRCAVLFRFRFLFLFFILSLSLGLQKTELKGQLLKFSGIPDDEESLDKVGIGTLAPHIFGVMPVSLPWCFERGLGCA